MKRITKCLLGISLLLSSLAAGGEGTLPFGKGRVPFNMIGQATAADASKTLSIDFGPQRLSNRIEREASRCPAGMISHNFSGTIKFNSSSYLVQTICSKTGRPNRVVIGQMGRSKLTLTGVLTQDQDGYEVFSGTANLEVGSQTQSYRFTVSE